MSLIPQGNWRLGEDSALAIPGDGEGPVRWTPLPAFLMDKTTITNRQFAAFVGETGYRTEAEDLNWSFVFSAQVAPDAIIWTNDPVEAPEWWLPVKGASWRNPNGGSMGLAGLADHPVVHVSWNDAVAYTLHAGKRLPFEDEWEAAARGGIEGASYCWGNELKPGGRHMCNIWQGRFPVENTAEDGFLATAPAQSFFPNGFGLYNMLGNVWEWTASRWSKNTPDMFAMRGGSYLCHASYCHRYRVSARTCNVPGATSSHQGFRCAADVLSR